MFFNRSLNFFITSSVMVHLAFLLLFDIHIAPSVNILSMDAKISFLGYFIGDVRPNLVMHSTSEGIAGGISRLPLLSDFNQNLVNAVAQPIKIYNDFSSKPIVSSVKIITDDSLSQYKSDIAMEKSVIKDDSGVVFTLEKGLQYNSVLYRPEVPAIRNWVEIDAKHLTAIFNISVDSTGRVYDIKLISSSGYAEADAVFIRYLRQWLFVPFNNGGKKNSITGTVSVTIPVR